MISTNKVCIRTAHEADINFIKDCMMAGQEESYLIPVSSPIPLADRIQSRLHEQPYYIEDVTDDYHIVFKYFIAELDGVRTGMLTTATHINKSLPTWHEYHVLYIMPEYRKMHIGAQLLYHAAIEDTLRGVDAIVVRCLVQEGQYSPAHFYFERCGFMDIAPHAPLGAATILETTPLDLIRTIDSKYNIFVGRNAYAA